MAKRLILAICMLLSAQAAFAQSFPKPPDVPAYVAVTPSYASGVSTNYLGDNSNARGGTPPGYANELANIASGTTVGKVSTSGISYCNLTDALGPCGHQGTQPKFRTIINITKALCDDPIRNYGQPGASHCHEFAGNRDINAYSTFGRLRAKPYSFAAGEDLNGTGYWFPCPVKTNPFSDGKNYCVKADYMIVYYAGVDATDATRFSRLIRGQRYVTGTNMDDPDDLIVKAEITAANAQPGTSGRYSYIGNGFRGWSCYKPSDGTLINLAAGGTLSPALETAGHTDPWAGACLTGYQLYAEVSAPGCWDGINLWSPGGYKHFRHKIRDNTAGKDVCPLAWYEVPTLEEKIFFTHSGAADFMTWDLSSDAMAATNAGHAILKGASFHIDWIGAWDGTIFQSWQTFCLGVDGNTPHECDYSTFSSTQRLISDSVSSDGKRNPQTNTTQQFGTATAGAMFQIRSNPTGTVTTHIHGN